MEGDDRKRVWVTITRVRCERETVRGHERGSKTVRGPTMTSSISVVSQSGSHVSSGSCYNSLWHLHLGHMSEKGLDILCK